MKSNKLPCQNWGQRSLFCSMNKGSKLYLFTSGSGNKNRKSEFSCEQLTCDVGRHAYNSKEDDYFCLSISSLWLIFPID